VPLAHHDGGPADGVTVQVDKVTQTRYYAPTEERTVEKPRGAVNPPWVKLARYVHVPPREGKHVRYRYTGEEQTHGPVPGTDDAPEWS
jgi:hypothetical protein